MDLGGRLAIGMIRRLRLALPSPRALLDIDRIPLLTQHPAERRELAVDPPPLELVPRTELLVSATQLDFGRFTDEVFPLPDPDGLVGTGKLAVAVSIDNLQRSGSDRVS